MTRPLVPVEALNERDIDLLVLEELTVSSEFAQWVVGRTHSDSVQCVDVVSAQHSLSDADGESDLVFVFRDGEGQSRALLIENKVNAPAQPAQAERYRIRAERGVGDGLWHHWRTCITAPNQYLASGEKASGYDAQVSYESIAEWFDRRAATDPRSRYRARLLRDAIERARRGGITRTDEQVTAFWRAYWTDAATWYPELEMKEPGDKSASATWIVFKPTKLGKYRSIDHKLERGKVELSLYSVPAEHVDRIRERFRAVLDDTTMAVVPVGKMVSVRIDVPPLNPWESYEVQSVAARQGLKAAYRLWALAHLLDPTP